MSKFKERESFSSDQWTYYQTHELQSILVHAFDNVPYYHERFTENGLTRSDLEQIRMTEILKLPVLPKEDLRRFGVSTLMSKKRSKRGSFYSSSGSTGTPTRIFFSKETHQKWSAAFEARIRNWAGVSRLDGRGMIGGRRVIPDGESSGPYYRYNSIEKQIYFSAYHISSNTAADYAYAMLKYKPAYMTGYAMSNYFLARFFDDNGIEAPTLKAVITSSEKLTSEMRALFQKIYKCKTYDSYSGVEACGLISENEYGQLLVSPDVGIIEILNEKGEPCKPGEVGECYCTGLLNYDQPLIRYRIGDKVHLAKDQRTLCGRNMVVIDEIMGRDEDVVRGPDGREMVRFHGLYIDIMGLAAGQLIQHEPDSFTINLQIESGRFNRNVAEKIIYQRLVSQLGKVKLKFEYPDRIPLGPNGKFKAVISELPKPL
ncbi:MAG: phenylacetate--CoA ligase family protein [Bacteroidales bacterium]|nr:phenylacetate--CoA ligase family protein [Bacteroidales bacterium]